MSQLNRLREELERANAVIAEKGRKLATDQEVADSLRTEIEGTQRQQEADESTFTAEYTRLYGRLDTSWAAMDTLPLTRLGEVADMVYEAQANFVAATAELRGRGLVPRAQFVDEPLKRHHIGRVLPWLRSFQAVVEPASESPPCTAPDADADDTASVASRGRHARARAMQAAVARAIDATHAPTSEVNDGSM